jgi:hypothetical protein
MPLIISYSSVSKQAMSRPFSMTLSSYRERERIMKALGKIFQTFPFQAYSALVLSEHTHSIHDQVCISDTYEGRTSMSPNPAILISAPLFGVTQGYWCELTSLRRKRHQPENKCPWVKMRNQSYGAWKKWDCLRCSCCPCVISPSHTSGTDRPEKALDVVVW